MKKLSKPYKELSINQKINYKSGWDIAVKYEGESKLYGKSKTRPYCKLSECMNREIPLVICGQDYNDSQKHRFLNGRGRRVTKLFGGLPK